jgi:hypothetical protein
MKILVDLLCICAGAAVFWGCAAAFEYPPYTPISRPTGRTMPLRVAIAYPDEGRSAPDRDEDLEPIITTQCVQAPTYISPRLEISRCLLDELRATQAFRVVDWVPESPVNYDVVVHLLLCSSGERSESEKCPMALGPWEWEITVTAQDGVELGRQRLTLEKFSLYSVSVYTDFRKKQQVFLAGAVTLVLAAADRVARGEADIEAYRMVTYDDAHDPDLKGIRARLLAATLDPSERQALEWDYLLRAAMLESLRVVEDQRIAAVQPQKDRAWAEMQQRYRMELEQVGVDTRAALQNSLSGALNGALNGVAAASNNSILTAVATMPGLQGAAGGSNDAVAKLVDAPGGMDTLLAPAVRLQGRESGASLQLPSDPEFRARLLQRLQILGRIPDPTGDPSGPWMNEYRRLVAGVVLPGDTPGLAFAGCGKDTDCKGDRLCVKGECVSGAVAAEKAALPAAPARMEAPATASVKTPVASPVIAPPSGQSTFTREDRNEALDVPGSHATRPIATVCALKKPIFCVGTGRCLGLQECAGQTGAFGPCACVDGATTPAADAQTDHPERLPEGLFAGEPQARAQGVIEVVKQKQMIALGKLKALASGDLDEGVRQIACWAIGEIGGASEIDVLRTVIAKDASVMVKREADISLMRLESKGGAPPTD